MTVERHWTPAYAGVTKLDLSSAAVMKLGLSSAAVTNLDLSSTVVTNPGLSSTGVTKLDLSSSRRRPGSSVLWLALLLCSLTFIQFARATVLVALTLDELVTASEVVFIGTVTDSVTHAEGDLVYTTLRFDVDGVVDGEVDGDTLELRFLGGNVGEQKTEVSGQYIPAVGDHGLFFVDDTVRDLVNPLTGWSQGHFPLIDVDGTTWLDLKNHPDYGLLEPDTDPLAEKMRSMGFTREQIAERFPERFRFPLSDFASAIAAIRAEQGE